MGLIDVVTGKVWRWNQMKFESNHLVCSRLQPFISARLPRYPELGEVFLAVRNYLYAYYLTAVGLIFPQLDDYLEPYKDKIMALNAYGFHHFLSAMHSVNLVTANSKNANVFAVMSEGVCEMYDRPDDYMRSWYALGQEITSDPSVASRITFKMHDEINAVLGLQDASPLDAMYWREFQHQTSLYTKDLYDSPDWGSKVESEFAAH